MRISKKGFTLIELLVAMTIVAVLMGLALVSYQGARKTARDGRRKTDLEQVRSGLEMYRSEAGIYPAGSGWSALGPIGTYIDIPSDPINSGVYIYTSYNSGGTTYTLCATLETEANDYCVYNP